jgi:hypothetical protein
VESSQCALLLKYLSVRPFGAAKMSTPKLILGKGEYVRAFKVEPTLCIYLPGHIAIFDILIPSLMPLALA